MIKNITGMEILDSRGRPTVWARCELASGIVGAASVPSGASTGRAEAHELRDGDPGRYRGLGCRKAVENINTRISQKVSGEKYESQESFDRELIALDGTTEKSNLGANAILACSLAFARARAAEEGVELYKYFGKLIGNSSFVLPRPTINLFSGGKHAGGQVPIQDVLIVPVSATTMDDCLRDIYAVY
ncbi:MAG: phosphopyruvate hydratase, partial [Cyclobacteriaceae bacterium]|nr:phosphopyruvate hydratase [Cyclobacteriaceae bacterium]